MKKDFLKKTLLLGVGLVLSAFSVSLIFVNIRETQKKSDIPATAQAPPAERVRNGSLQDNFKKPQIRPSQRFLDSDEPYHNAERLLRERKKLSDLYSGSQLVEEQIKFNGRAVEKLSGLELLTYFKGVYDAGAGKDFDLTIVPALGKAFGSDSVEQSLEWLASTRDPAFKMRIAYFVGDVYYGNDFTSVMQIFESPSAQAKFLAGKCAQLAVSDLPGAIRTFVSNKPSSVDFSEMKSVFNMTRADADFRSANDLIPSDARTVATDVRAALFRRWAEYHPKAVADFIMSGNDKVSMVQLPPILNQWYETNAEEALDWVNLMSPGTSKDLGVSSLIDPILRRSPDSAWEVAMQINDQQRRDGMLKKVYSEWVKIDPDAAEFAKSEFTRNSD